jgi:hypothetical protein
MDSPLSTDTIRRQSHDQLPTFETSLDAEGVKLMRLKEELTDLTNGRENAIRVAVENSPSHVAADNGFLAQIRVLEQITQEDTKIAVVVVLIDVVSFGLELAAVLAKVTSSFPTAYGALLARDAYMRAVRIVDEMMAELREIDSQEHQQPEILPPESPRGNPRSNKAALSGSIPCRQQVTIKLLHRLPL